MNDRTAALLTGFALGVFVGAVAVAIAVSIDPSILNLEHACNGVCIG